MKNILAVIFLALLFKTSFAQESYFSCDEVAVYLTNKSVIISLPGQSKENVRKKIMSFISERNYVYKPFYSNGSMISFRDFVKFCDKSKCGSDLIAKNIFHLTYDSGFLKIDLENEIFSSFYGGELVINDNDDVASKMNVPFAPYEFKIPEQYSNEYPESIYSFNRKGKIKIKNQEVQKIILNFYNQYISDIKSYFKN